MKFGIFGGVKTAPGVEDGYHQGYRAYIDAVVEAERLLSTAAGIWARAAA